MAFVSRFFLAVIVVSFVELFLLVRVAASFGFLFTLLACILTGVVGGALVRLQGWQTIVDIRRQASAGRVPTVEIASGALLLIVGALLITPGFLTDIAGFLLLVPRIRRRIARFVVAAIDQRIALYRVVDVDAASASPKGYEARVIDVQPDETPDKSD